MGYISDLADEINSDPLARGYSGMSDQQVADDLNTSYRTKNRDRMSGTEIADAIAAADYNALADAQKDRVIGLTNRDSINPFGFSATVMIDVFGAGSDTITALQAARVDSITRAAELFGKEVKVGHVKDARTI